MAKPNSGGLSSSLLVQADMVSTVIPVFNRPDMIRDAVQSVLAQTHRPIEIIIVDDGSTDNTPTVLKQLSEQHEEVRVFTQKNAGPGVAREHGRLNVRGEFIQYLDSDDVLLPVKFAQQVAALKSQPQASAAYGKTEVIEFDAKPIGVAHRETGVAHTALFPSFLYYRWWFTSTPLYRRSVLEKAGPWSDAMNEEDWEYDCRIASLGGGLAFVDEFVSLHRVHKGHASNDDAHLSADGTRDANKLAHRAMSRARIFQHAKDYMKLNDRPSSIEQDDWAQFSKYTFLLARQCAKAGLSSEARAMTTISIEAVGKKTPQHWLFLKLVTLLGWQRAARVVEATGR